MARIRETDLFEPIKRYLDKQGYDVHGEVRSVDIVARHRKRRDEIIALELKTRMSLSLIAQAVRRKEITDAVYVVVPLFGANDRLRNGGDIVNILRRLEIGLLTVRFLKRSTRVEPLLHPLPSELRRRPSRTRAILREIDGRYAEFDLGGAATRAAVARESTDGDASLPVAGPGPARGVPPRKGRLTAYRQKALLIAALLAEYGPSSPAKLKRRGAPAQCGTILSRNVYGWFDRPERGVYVLHEAGKYALNVYEPETKIILETIERRTGTQ